MNPSQTATALNAVCKQLVPRRDGWHVSLMTGIDNQARYARGLVHVNELRLLPSGNAGAFVDLVSARVKHLARLLWPEPPPPFRIGTKPHAKRLRPAPRQA